MDNDITNLSPEERLRYSEYIQRIQRNLTPQQLETLRMAQGPEQLKDILKRDTSLNPDALTADQYWKRMRAFESLREQYKAPEQRKEEETREQKDEGNGRHQRVHAHAQTYEEFDKEAELHAQETEKEWIKNNPEPKDAQSETRNNSIRQLEESLRKNEGEFEALHRDRLPDLNKIRGKEEELKNLERKRNELIEERRLQKAIADEHVRDQTKARISAKQKFYDDYVRLDPKGSKQWVKDLEKQGKKPSSHLLEAIRKVEEAQKKAGKGVRQRVLTTLGAGALAVSMSGSPTPIQQPAQSQRSSWSPQTITTMIANPTRTALATSRTGSAPRPRFASPIRATRGNAKGMVKNLAEKGARKAIVSGVAAVLGAILSIPVIIVIVIVVVIAAVVAALFFWLPNSNANPGKITVPPPGVGYYLRGNSVASNGENINYQISFICDPDQTDCTSYTLVDTLPGSTQFESATGNYDNSIPDQVRWAIAENTPVDTPHTDKIDFGILQVYTFSLTIKPTQDDITVTDTISLETTSP